MKFVIGLCAMLSMLDFGLSGGQHTRSLMTGGRQQLERLMQWGDHVASRTAGRS
jgi:hypothetical protein